MTADLTDYTVEDLAALYAAGALTPAESAQLELSRQSGWPEFEAAVGPFTLTTADLAADLPEVAPPPGVLTALLAAIDAPPAVPPGYTIRPAADADFHPLPYPGVSMRLLHIDRLANRFSCLLKFAPGGRLPGHPHSSAEECVVLDGTLMVGGVRMNAGDYQRVEAGVTHVEQWSDTGATAFVTAPLDLLEH